MRILRRLLRLVRELGEIRCSATEARRRLLEESK